MIPIRAKLQQLIDQLRSFLGERSRFVLIEVQIRSYLDSDPGPPTKERARQERVNFQATDPRQSCAGAAPRL